MCCKQVRHYVNELRLKRWGRWKKPDTWPWAKCPRRMDKQLDGQTNWLTARHCTVADWQVSIYNGDLNFEGEFFLQLAINLSTDRPTNSKSPQQTRFDTSWHWWTDSVGSRRKQLDALSINQSVHWSINQSIPEQCYPTHRDIDGLTALDHAENCQMRCHLSINHLINHLIPVQCDPTRRDIYGLTALDLAENSWMHCQSTI